MILKLDMTKAYDRVDWCALCLVLSKLGFSKSWIKWVHSCISFARFSVLLNGSPCGFFSSYRGIRQGDPLSLFLFILLVEAFSWAIRAARSAGLWKGISISEVLDPVSHCLFVDDTLLFGHASMSEAKVNK